MNLWYPEISRRGLWNTIGIAAWTAACAGMYGAIHDQISYTISPEYFTKMKFAQFTFADFGAPPRVLAAEVGFLASWWVGFIGGWFLARLGLAELTERFNRRYLVRAVALAIGVAITIGVIGALVGVVRSCGEVGEWELLRDYLGIHDLHGFIVVSYLHWASYLGGILGIVVAGVYVRRLVAYAKRTEVRLQSPVTN